MLESLVFGVIGALAPIIIGLVQLLGTGIMLGIGFWIAKRITNYIESKMIQGDEAFMAELARDINPGLV